MHEKQVAMIIVAEIEGMELETWDVTRIIGNLCNEVQNGMDADEAQEQAEDAIRDSDLMTSIEEAIKDRIYELIRHNE